MSAAVSAIIMTGGIANPAFTILALTMRLADQLKQRLLIPFLLSAETRLTSV